MYRFDPEPVIDFVPVVGISSPPVPVIILAEDWDTAPNEDWLIFTTG